MSDGDKSVHEVLEAHTRAIEAHTQQLYAQEIALGRHDERLNSVEESRRQTREDMRTTREAILALDKNNEDRINRVATELRGGLQRMDEASARRDQQMAAKLDATLATADAQRRDAENRVPKWLMWVIGTFLTAAVLGVGGWIIEFFLFKPHG